MHNIDKGHKGVLLPKCKLFIMGLYVISAKSPRGVAA